MYLKSLKTLKTSNGMRIANRKVPVMNRLLGRRPASPKKSRHPARATANEAALKRGRTGRGKSEVGTVKIATVHKQFGRPVPKQYSETPLLWSGVLCIWGIFGESGRLSIPGNTKVHLPAGALRCSIKLAYEAADASHPNG